jgi:hypothetical protein
MADLTITPANVIRQEVAGQVKVGVLGEAIDAGESAYLADDGSYYLTDANDSAKPSNKQRLAICLSSGGTGQTSAFASGDGSEIELGAAVGLAGQVLILSENPGKIKLASDLAAGEFLTVLGYMKSTSRMVVASSVSSIAKA